MINLVALPYRDAYFFRRYGPAVRDLQFILELEKLAEISRISVINRPVSLLEKATSYKRTVSLMESDKIATIDSISWDLFGPLRRRRWMASVYPRFLRKNLNALRDDSKLNVILDFLPFGLFDAETLDGWVYWYDFIDNFLKHNRFTQAEKNLVAEKYSSVAELSNQVTAVSAACLSNVGLDDHESAHVVSNKVFAPNSHWMAAGATREFEATYDFGFIGFITNKLDVEFIGRLAQTHTVALFGEVMDGQVGTKLESIDGVSLHGRFQYSDLPSICSSFRIGLIPYLQSKSHDGSPLKLYEYLKFNRPCLTSIDYEVSEPALVVNYRQDVNWHTKLEAMFSKSGSPEISGSIKAEWRLGEAINDVVSRIVESCEIDDVDC